MRRFATLLLFFSTLAPFAAAAEPPATTRPTLKNPIIGRDAPDPWVIRHDGFYYFTATLESNGGLWVWRSRTLGGLDAGEKVKVWTPAPGTLRNMWAPEVYTFDGRWFIYFTATSGNERVHHHYVLEGDGPTGPYTLRGRVDPDYASHAIDGSVLTMPDGRRFWMDASNAGGLGIAPMTSPTRVDSSRRISMARASLPWERGWIEAPQALIRDGRVFVVYSAGHSATPHYVLGLLSLKPGGDPLDPAAWTKSPAPVFGPYVGAEGAIYNVGHCAFTTSPDGNEDWIVYHGKEWADPNVGGFGGRKARAQRFTWNADGTPHFGRPLVAGEPTTAPSGE